MLPVPAATAALDGPAASRLVATFLGSLSPNTRRAYASDLAEFAGWCGAATVDAAVGQLLATGHGAANEAALRYREHLTGRGLSPATVNRHTAALRSVARLGRVLGLIGWQIDVGRVKSEPYRDTRGPGLDAFRRMLALLDGRTNPKAVRDRAILLTLFSQGLRRKELVGLDYPGDLDLDGGGLWVVGKGRTERERLTLPAETAAALRDWLGARGTAAGPLFVALDRAHRGHRLTGQAVYDVVSGLGARAGVKTWPHALRHLAITRALDLTGGDVRAVQKFSRHKDVRVIQRYDDARVDSAGEIARKLAGGL
jgi:integrase/recombinase XerC